MEVPALEISSHICERPGWTPTTFAGLAAALGFKLTQRILPQYVHSGTLLLAI